MAENTIEKRNKEPGVLGKLWNQTGATVGNAGGVLEQATGITLDTFTLGRKTIAPSIIDANVEIMQSVAQGVQDLMAMGVTEKEARTYIMNGVSI